MSNDKKLESLANKIRLEAGIPDEEKFGSVIAILMVISIILTLVRVLQECNKNKLTPASTQQDICDMYGKEIKNYSTKRGWLTKLRIKRVIKKNMTKDQYSKYGEALLYSILNAGSNLDGEEVSAIMSAVNT